METIRILVNVKDGVGVVASLKACMIEVMYDFLVVMVKWSTTKRVAVS